MKIIYSILLSFLLLSCAKETDELFAIEARDSVSNKHYIEGVLSFGNDKIKINSIEVEYRTGAKQKIYFNDLQSVLISQCISEQINNSVIYNDPIGRFACYYSGTQNVNPIQVESYHSNGSYSYQDRVCSQAIYSCVGYKFLELSETQEIKTIEGVGVEVDTNTVPFTSGNHFDRYIRYDNTSPVYRHTFYSGIGLDGMALES